jgi:hypothetical protein
MIPCMNLSIVGASNEALSHLHDIMAPKMALQTNRIVSPAFTTQAHGDGPDDP